MVLNSAISAFKRNMATEIFTAENIQQKKVSDTKHPVEKVNRVLTTSPDVFIEIVSM
jgi:hypothetical protein